jgi:hypothetical protein
LDGIRDYIAEDDIGHVAVEQLLGAQLRVHMNQDAVGSLSLAGVAGHGIAMVEMQMRARIEGDRAVYVANNIDFTGVL